MVISALTVALSLSALLLFPMPFLRSLGYAGIAVTALAALTAVVLIPAMLALVGHRLDRADLFAPIRRRITRRRARAGEDRLAGHRIAALVMRRPALILVSVSAVLIVPVLPFAGVRFGLLDHRTLPADHPVAETAENLERDFPAAAEDPITVVMPERDATSVGKKDLAEYAARLSTLPGVSTVETATGRYIDGETSDPPSQQTAGLEARYASSAGTWVAVTPAANRPADTPATSCRTSATSRHPGPRWSAVQRPPWSTPPTPSLTGCRGHWA